MLPDDALDAEHILASWGATPAAGLLFGKRTTEPGARVAGGGQATTAAPATPSAPFHSTTPSTQGPRDHD